jgi:DNA-binding transcriptional MocR family regulator
VGRVRTNSSVLVALDHDGRIPLHRQIETSIRGSIRAGRLPRGSPLPPSRVLAADLGVSRGVVVEAYQQLTSEGYLASRAGGYTQVAADPSRATAGLRLARAIPPRIDLSYGRADVSSFPRSAWLRAICGALYAGSASKTLAPGLRLGWFVMPGHLAEPMAAAKIAADRGSPALEQLALADLIIRGEFDRHLRRMRPVYRRRRDALLAALNRRLPWLRPAGVSAGLHLVTWLPPHLDESAVVEAAARAGVGIEGVTPYRISHPGPGGLIFGYATVNEQAIAEGIDILARVIGEP